MCNGINTITIKTLHGSIGLKTSVLKIEKDGKYQVMWSVRVKDSASLPRGLEELACRYAVIRAMEKLLRL